MLKSNTKAVPPVEAVLRIDMIVDGEPGDAGEVVELSAHDFKYLHTYNRVLAATPENIALVKAEVDAAKLAAKKAATYADDLATTRAQLAAVSAELAKFKKAS